MATNPSTQANPPITVLPRLVGVDVSDMSFISLASLSQTVITQHVFEPFPWSPPRGYVGESEKKIRPHQKEALMTDVPVTAYRRCGFRPCARVGTTISMVAAVTPPSNAGSTDSLTVCHEANTMYPCGVSV